MKGVYFRVLQSPIPNLKPLAWLQKAAIQIIYTMKNVLLLLLLVAVSAQSCDILRRSGKSDTSSKSKKGSAGIDKTVIAPTEYSTQDRNLDYITKYSRAAALSMDRIGVPASIVLAQGVLESAAGTSDLATAAKNHFGVLQEKR